MGNVGVIIGRVHVHKLNRRSTLASASLHMLHQLRSTQITLLLGSNIPLLVRDPASMIPGCERGLAPYTAAQAAENRVTL